jgi:hypothetical protein
LLTSLVRWPLRDVDLVIIGASKVDCFERWLEIADRIPSGVPTVFLDGGDYPGVGEDLSGYGRRDLWEQALARRPFDLVFKREMLIGQDYGPKVFPLPMSANMERFRGIRASVEAKRYDVSFWAVESHPIRVQALELLKDRFDCAENGTVRNQKFSRYKRKGRFYLQELARCRVTLNLRGGGWDTMRYWEVPAVGGFMITQRPGIVIPHDFRNGVHTVHCAADLSDLVELCGFYLRHEKEREAIAARARAHLLEHHTDTARARYLLGILHDHLPALRV